MKKIVFYSDSPFLNTGMGKVIREVALRFQQGGYEVQCAGWHHNIIENSPRAPKLPLKTIHIDKAGNKTGQLFEFINHVQPDVLFCLGDIFYFGGMSHYRTLYSKMFKKELKIIGYFNVDAVPLRPEYADILDGFDKIICTSSFGKRAITDALLVSADRAKEIEVIYHGVDTAVFTPKEKDSSKFTMLVNSKNSLRKNIPLTLEAVSLLARKHKDISLILNTDPRDKDGSNLIDYVDRLPGLYAVTSFVKGSSVMEGISDADLASLYQRSHVLILCSMGEGFGLPYVEAMATKSVCLGTDYSATREILADGRGVLISARGYIHGINGQKMMIANEKDLAEKLEKLYTDWKYKQSSTLNRIADRAYTWVQDYTWDACYTKIRASIEGTKIRRSYLPPLESYRFLRKVRQLALEQKEKCPTGAKYIGVVKLGGFGDTLQMIPVLKGIRRKYPQSYIIALIENGAEILSSQGLVNGVIEIKSQHYLSVFKSVLNVFDLLYDLRYVSRVYGEPITDFASKHIEFYKGWAFSNNMIDSVGMHVVDLMLKSCGLEEFASISDLSFGAPDLQENIRNLGMEPGKFVTVANSVGNVGSLKLLPPGEIEKIVQKINSLGFSTVLLGTDQDAPIEGVTKDLRGKLPIPYVAGIIKQALAHVGVEGFLYHLAHAVGTRSLCWYSCTPPVCFSYKEDVTMFARKCRPCWWNSVVGEGWWTVCCRGESRCLNLPPLDMMLDRIETELTLWSTTKKTP
jgi:glycosyltransferase involved in cell wall biosynthesis/ADP-heptose:LPS heptosyltransferase